MRRAVGALGAGVLFGLGLVVSGMTDPRNVVAFLDFAGRWSPNLAAVMVGAIGVHFTALRWLGARGYPVVGVDRRPWIDGRVVLGAAIFGAGWGLAGYCPGPAVVALGFGAPATWAFVAPMLAGLLLGEAAASWHRGRGAAEVPGASAC
ncbi:MAG TPA: DUF6691 family protein [Polyangia bacterium]|nr:DUF6691 family protein [Polyangia bacterium]